MKITEIKILITEYQNTEELSEQNRNLIHEARNITKLAYSPYSSFNVGAAVLLENGKIITGNNQENSAYPSGLCAERVALFYANANFPESAVKTIAISASKNGELVNDPVKPCGSCRQVISETEFRFEKPIRILLDGKEKILSLNGIQCLLPLCFSKNDL